MQELELDETVRQFSKAAGIFGLSVCNWIFITQFLDILYLCRYILIEEMGDGFSLTPPFFTTLSAFCSKLALPNFQFEIPQACPQVKI